MRVFLRESRLSVPADEAFAWHLRPGAFERLVPPWQRVEVLAREGGIEEGGTITLRVHLGWFHRRWVARHRDIVPGRQFRDEQVSGPFASWLHTHRVLPAEGGGCVLEDQVDYEAPAGALGAVLLTPRIDRLLDRLFAFRHRRTALDLGRHLAHAPAGPLRIAVSGASGLIGSALVPFLSAGGHRVQRLVRSPGDAGPDAVRWDPARGLAEPAALSGCDAVVHLAGSPVADRRWTRARKRELVDSRVTATRRLCEDLAALAVPPPVLICASAIGYYGDRGASAVDEGAGPGTGFLSDLCLDWEAACAPARAAGIRVVNARIGVVLAARGGAVAKLVPAVRAGIAGPVGPGTQLVSWIALDDAVGALHHLIRTPSLRGPVNLVAPRAVTNRDLVGALGRVLGRPTVLPVPALAIRALFGEMGRETVLAGADVRPRRLEESGFAWAFTDLEDALRFELGLSWGASPASRMPFGASAV